jgi:hypothetical protein
MEQRIEHGHDEYDQGGDLGTRDEDEQHPERGLHHDDPPPDDRTCAGGGPGSIEITRMLPPAGT